MPAMKPLIAAFAFLTLTAAAGAQEPVHFPSSELTLHTASGDHDIVVEVAETPAQRQRGLMYRTELAEDHGMIFLFGTDKPVSMWMANTLIPLDMVFIRADGSVAGYHENAEPRSERIIASDEPVRYVLELGGGEAKAYDLKPGDMVTGPALSE
ncbi:DUF192 domain-containing protein [Martelella endophytica]|uniref:Uncharacterized protein n=1 Tax=Martelella endophytica TaxID=1486262 RepID=A0A0D5LTI6_MAREN|nr:DUF192 domain-containing protein [Martelella endophytica]AJY47077.1 hypothetical protein TM49_17620 [Martelella endophytica]